jgi:hypothetical protein
MADLRIDIASEFIGAKAFKQADSATARLENRVSSLAKTFVSLYTAQKLVAVGINAAKAFAADDAAAVRLTNSVKNLGLAYAADDIRKYVDTLTLATGVADSQLRPALQSLLQVTGSVTKSQELLSNAIDISRGSGEDLATVSNDLSQAYVGNLKGLRKYNLGLTQAELKASSFADIQKRLNGLFAGSSTAYLATYSGQMQILSNTAKEAQEVIGKDLVDALILVSGQTGVKGLASDMNDLAIYTGNAIYGIGVLLDKLNNSKIVKLFGGFDINMIPIVGGIISNLAATGASAKAAKNTFNFASGGGLGTGSTKGITDRQALAAEKAAKKRAAEILAIQKQQLKATKDQTTLQKAGTLFDVEQTQIIAALKGKITDDERKRLELQLAILTGNTAEASKLAYELARAQGITEGLAKYLAGISQGNPFAAWATYLDQIEKRVKSLSMSQLPVGGTAMPPTNVPVDTSGAPVNYGYTAANPSFTYGQGNPLYITVNNAGSVIAQNDLIEEIRSGLLGNSLSGSPSQIGRLKGSFAG